MEVKITSQKQNPLLKRNEVVFQIEHEQAGGTPTRPEIRKAVASTLKTDESVVFIKRFETKTGMRVATGTANSYDSIEQAIRVEPEYIIKRNLPPEKSKGEVKEKNV